MGLLEKSANPDLLGVVEGSIPVEFLYTHGRAGERFFRALKDGGKLLAARCPRCRELRLPPKTYCETCFVAVPESAWEEVPLQGRLEAVARVHRSFDGTPLPEPLWMGFVRFEGATGGLLVPLVEPAKPYRVGDRVAGELIAPPRRTGALTDLAPFRRA